ncbi:permease [Oceanobacter sp. 3_MG-2023]|uniref:permease n=1 Tax=Oceanobacter sp. 3_MG-2023 TaxID=3062622 RepID=UPI002737798D|nr:permease [Oceanobacter sp. 3_MG-2023]MDP2504767.1 permease [Oceanobacter sp. 3_MG-2023]
MSESGRCCGSSDSSKSSCLSESGVANTEPAAVSAGSCCGGASAVAAGPVVFVPAAAATAARATSSSCCGGGDESTDGADCCAPSASFDWVLWGSGLFVVAGYLGWLSLGDVGLTWVSTLMHTSFEMVNAMWWGIISASVFVGLLGRIPRELVMSVLGQAGTQQGIFRATLAGLMLDLCNHGILMIGMKLYERGASIGQVMAFLIASPWNSLTLTLILVGLIGLQWTLTFIAASLVIAWISGLIFDRLVVKGVLPANPHHQEPQPVNAKAILKQVWRDEDWSLPGLAAMFWQGLKESRSVLRWVFLGVVLVALVRAFVPEESFNTWFGATAAGMFMTLLAATVIEVCSEGSSPIAADLVTRAAAPGNSFTFLMAGAATDYTEIMSLKDTTRSWKIALFLPLITVPQVLLIGWLMNSVGS